ncbi:hypothetical protein MTP99_014863 [Tenebrio molitor]|nr:hypothetical protein MTP99_014863 [Tenebrio molitor]
MEFTRSEVLLSVSYPPEELLSGIAGGCGLWQLCIIAAACTAEFLHAFDVYSLRTSTATFLNYTCKNGNGSRCFTANGSVCTEFIFYKQHPVTTFAEKLELICDKEWYVVWLENAYRIGLILGYGLTGGCADKFGLKISSMVFLALQCLTGLLTISMKEFAVVIFFLIIHGFCCTFLYVFPKTAVCDAVGNKWRTLALGATMLTFPVVLMVFPFFYNIFTDIAGVIAAVSVVPLILLIPLLYYKDSPNYIFLMTDISKGEDTLRHIAEINKHPMSPNAKIRPVQIIIDNKVPKPSCFSDVWKPSTTRYPYLALLCCWFAEGVCVGVLMNHVYSGFAHIYLYGFCALVGCLIGIVLCYRIQHRVVIGIFGFLKTIFIGGLHLFDVLHNSKNNPGFIALEMLSGVLIWISFTALDNLTPRMFPTEMRNFCFGLCLSVFHVGYMIASLMLHSSPKEFWQIGVMLVVAATLETLASFWFWEVHNRELPDYLQDCENFKTYYKPTRYLNIFDRASQHEIEVKVMELNRTDWRVKKKPPPPSRQLRQTLLDMTSRVWQPHLEATSSTQTMIASANRNLRNEVWFFGDISPQQCKELLLSKPNGYFLVRNSRTFPGDFTLCLSFDDNVENYRIQMENRKWTIDNEKYFYTVQELIEHYKQDADGLSTRLVATVGPRKQRSEHVKFKDRRMSSPIVLSTK